MRVLAQLAEELLEDAEERLALRNENENLKMLVKASESLKSGYLDELERLRASQERLKSAIEFAHSEGFQWPSDPMAEFAQPEPVR